MSSSKSLTRSVAAQLQRSQAKWDRLRRMTGTGANLPDQAEPDLDALRDQKPLTTWKVRRQLAGFRRHYRKTYRQEAEQLLARWRPEYRRMLAAVKKYRQTTAMLFKNEVKQMKRTVRHISHMRARLGHIRRKLTRSMNE